MLLTEVKINKISLWIWSLAGVVAIGLFFRFLNYNNRWIFNQDQARDAIIAWYGLSNGVWPEIGSPSSAGPFNFGPWYFWIIMMMEKISFGWLLGPWVGFTILSVSTVIPYYLIGRKIGGSGLGFIMGIIAAVATGGVENAPDMLNTVIVGWSTAWGMYFLVKMIEDRIIFWGILGGFFIGLSMNFHFQALGLGALLAMAILINNFKLADKFRVGILTGTGWFLSFVPLIIFDINNNWVWIKSVIEYYTEGVKKFYVPVRWLTELRDFWPQLFGKVIAGEANLGYLILILGLIAVILSRKKLFKLPKSWWVIVISLMISVLLMRFYKGVRSREYLIAFHGYIIFLTAWVVGVIWEWKKLAGGMVLGLILVWATINNWQVIWREPSQANEMMEIKAELDKRIEGGVEIFHYMSSDMVSLPIFYLYYRENRIGEGEAVSFCDGNKYDCPSGEIINRNNYRVYRGRVNEGWYRLTDKNIYERLMVNYGEKQAGSFQKLVTIVNPVRSRELWKDKSLEPIKNQYKIISELDLKATWLIQNDVLDDEELVEEIKKFDNKQELGIFLEVSEKLAKKARVYYPINRPWYSPEAVFLSGYEISERKLLIDTMMKNFKNELGYYPKSVGAWWIDSWSLLYLEKKYGIKTAMIVTDQKTTDNYGVWGQWWGVPYYPDKVNILAPGDLEVLVLQWALRDPVKAYEGEGPRFSNFSMQANDYISQGLDILYFEKLANIYFDERNKIGQITVGLETGIESVGFLDEYKRQLEWIKNEGVVDVSMSEMEEKYKMAYGGKNPDEVRIDDWLMTPDFRENKKLGEKTEYIKGMAFGDYFEKDSKTFLNRIYKSENLVKGWRFPYLWLGMAGMIGLVILLKIKIFPIAAGWLGLKIMEHLRYSVVEEERMLGILVDNFRFIGVTDKIRFLNEDLSNLVAQTMLKIEIKEIYYLVWILGIILVKLISDEYQKRRKN